MTNHVESITILYHHKQNHVKYNGKVVKLRLIYTEHARDQMIERRISEEEVEACWNDHLTDYPDKKGNPNYIGDVKGRRIKVVVSKADNRIIITVAD